MTDLKPVEWRNDKLIILDQTRLPGEEVYLEITDYQKAVEAIQRLAVRGAPAIGVAAGYAVALGALAIKTMVKAEFLVEMQKVISSISQSRPTARNLFCAIERMEEIVTRGRDPVSIKAALVEQAIKIHHDQMQSDTQLSLLGAALLKEGDTVLTHCNTGALATAGYGTALGVIKQAFTQGKKIRVIATETRPLLQGARLTAFELKRAGIPFALITDSMAGSLMRRGVIDVVIVGADRIARNGDTANKIGTYSLAVLAKEHDLPFYVAAPVSTIDLSLPTGEGIIIEERSSDEVTGFQGLRTAPQDVPVFNPAFDVTPYQYITAIVTEKGIVRGQYEQELLKLT
jgi:methylthioribose-1-phosphate isomerase